MISISIRSHARFTYVYMECLSIYLRKSQWESECRWIGRVPGRGPPWGRYACAASRNRAHIWLQTPSRPPVQVFRGWCDFAVNRSVTSMTLKTVLGSVFGFHALPVTIITAVIYLAIAVTVVYQDVPKNPPKNAPGLAQAWRDLQVVGTSSIHHNGSCSCVSHRLLHAHIRIIVTIMTSSTIISFNESTP